VYAAFELGLGIIGLLAAFRDAPHRRRLFRLALGGSGVGGLYDTRHHRGSLPAAANLPDGRNPACGRSSGWRTTPRVCRAGVFLRRANIAGADARTLAGGLLPAPASSMCSVAHLIAAVALETYWPWPRSASCVLPDGRRSVRATRAPARGTAPAVDTATGGGAVGRCCLVFFFLCCTLAHRDFRLCAATWRRGGVDAPAVAAVSARRSYTVHADSREVFLLGLGIGAASDARRSAGGGGPGGAAGGPPSRAPAGADGARC
jgi:hypothetical protein